MKKILATLGLISVFALAGCSRGDLTDVQLESVDATQIKSVSNAPVVNQQVVSKFTADVAVFGVKLTPDQLKLISLQRHLKTTGIFASRPAEHLTSDQNLLVHFNKHKSQFPGVTTKEAYLASAKNYLDNNTTAVYYFDTTSFAKGYQSNVVKHDAKTMELSAVRSNGDITTYYKDNKMDPKRFVVVPADFYYQ